MSTLAEVALAAERLPIPEQHQLLEQLASKLCVQPGKRSVDAPAVDRAARDAWLAELEREAKKNSTGRRFMAIEQILEESREERI